MPTGYHELSTSNGLFIGWRKEVWEARKQQKPAAPLVGLQQEGHRGGQTSFFQHICIHLCLSEEKLNYFTLENKGKKKKSLSISEHSGRDQNQRGSFCSHLLRTICRDLCFAAQARGWNFHLKAPPKCEQVPTPQLCHSNSQCMAPPLSSIVAQPFHITNTFLLQAIALGRRG